MSGTKQPSEGTDGGLGWSWGEHQNQKPLQYFRSFIVRLSYLQNLLKYSHPESYILYFYCYHKVVMVNMDSLFTKYSTLKMNFVNVKVVTFLQINTS